MRRERTIAMGEDDGREGVGALFWVCCTFIAAGLCLAAIIICFLR